MKTITNSIEYVFKRLVIKPEYGFGEEGWPTFKIPSNATLEYIVTLKRLERQPESYTLDTKQSLVQAKSIKDRATIYFLQKKYAIAARVYEKANNYLKNCTSKFFLLKCQAINFILSICVSLLL